MADLKEFPIFPTEGTCFMIKRILGGKLPKGGKKDSRKVML
jgi:hypothetical protein